MQFALTLIFGLIFYCWSGFVYAEELTENTKSQLTLDLRSDLWTNVYQNKDNPVRIYELKLNTLFYKNDEWQAEAYTGIQGLSTGRSDLVVGPRRILVGTDLRDQGIGARLHRNSTSGESIDLSVEYKSVSDEPFQDQRDIWTEVRLIYRFSPSPSGQWLFLLNDSKNRGFLNGQTVVLPGYTFYLKPEAKLTVGLPFVQMEWVNTLLGDMLLEVFPMRANVQFQNPLRENMIYEVKTGINTRSYLHINRIEDAQRLFVEESYAENALRLKLSEMTSLKLTVGYGFNRFLYEGKQVYLPTGRRTTMHSDAYGSIRWDWVF